MVEQSSPFSEIRQIIAADQRCGSVSPQNDHIWELTTSRGEPPGLALHTTYGLRAYGMRIFPRFVYKKMPISDPRAFASHPVLDFSAPNFLSVNYSPISSIDVNQKVWVPGSQTLVAQVTVTNNTAALVQIGMEWVVLLNPLITGSSMTTSQISVNTVLQGQTQHLYPVFFLTGGPQGDLSALPSLGIELSLTPNASRQFSWALAALESTDASFYSARKATAYSLDNEQIKIGMLQKQQLLNFDFADLALNQQFLQSQQRVFQLLMPPYRRLNHSFYLNNRLPDQGYGLSEKGSQYSPDGGLQRMAEIWELSRMLLPARSDLVKEMIQNLLDQQGDNGIIFAQSSWSGNITKLPAIPLLVSLVLDLHEYNADLTWLLHIQPALERYIKAWFTIEHDADQDGFPEWKHLLQTGFAESTPLEAEMKMNLQMLVQTAEWPSLAALLVNECKGLIQIANLTGEPVDTPWLEEQINRLNTILEQCWDNNQARYHYRDKDTHFSGKGKIVHACKQDGTFEIQNQLSHPSRLSLKIKPRDGGSRSIECKLKGIVKHHEKSLILSTSNFQWEDGVAFTVTEEFFSAVKQITVSGLKRGDLFSVEQLDFSMAGPDFLIPLWAGIPSQEQADKMIQSGVDLVDALTKNMPLYLKIMWLEGLCKYNHEKIAQQFYAKWFFNRSANTSGPTPLNNIGFPNMSTAGLNQLIPIKPLLQLLSIQKITENEVILKGFNNFLPKVNVQYKKFTLALEETQARITGLNGESVLVTEHGTHRIILS